jgi:predicted amidohydrolase YtcJ
LKTEWLCRPALLLQVVFLTCFVNPQSPETNADVVLLHGRIYTVDSKHPWAEAIAVREGKILAVGSDGQIAKYRGPSTKIIDAKGRLVLPGFTDCHVHFMEGSLLLQQIYLNDAKTILEIQGRVKAYAAAHPNEQWILGRGWNYPVFAPSGMPDKKYLDEIVHDRPVYLDGFDGHTWWANSKALQLAHITRDTPDPPGGAFVRDPGTGDLTGAIKEDAADAFVRRVIPEPSHEEKLKTLRAGIELANRLGLTRVHGLTEIDALRDDLHNVDLIQDLQRNDELTLRFYLAYRVDPPEVNEQQLREIVQARDRYHDDWIAAGAVKFFMDGVIETHTAAMLAPYSDDPTLSGQLFWDIEKYKKGVAELDRRRIQVFTHAIGDRAIRTALDAYENAAAANGTTDARHRIEHIEDVSAEDIPRFGKLDVIASMQPLHAYPDDDTLKAWAPNVGPERAKRAWVWHSIQAAGGVLAFGSDWPVVTLSPWAGLQNALTRQTTEGDPKGGWIPSERIGLADAIKGYTLNAAFAGHRERSEGSLEPGKLADLIVVSQDLFKIDPMKIVDTQVMLTMVGGRVVYTAKEF